MSRPGTTDALREAIARAIVKAEKRKSEKDTCPADDDGCGKRAALLTLSFRGIAVMKLCQFCPWTSAASGIEDKRTKLRLVKKAAKP